MTYIHLKQGWPEFHWDDQRLSRPLAAARHRQGRLIGRMETAPARTALVEAQQALDGLSNGSQDQAAA